MTSHGDKICRFPIPEISNLPEDIRKEILKIQEKMGFVPNVFLILSRRPEEFRAFFSKCAIPKFSLRFCIDI